MPDYNKTTSGQTVAELTATAVGYLRQSRIAEAIEAFERLIATRPDHPDDWYNLGYLYRCARKFQPALDAYRQALALNIVQPEEVLVNRAAILFDHLDRSGEAQQELEKALSINPRFMAAWLNLGNLHEECGDPEKARSAYEAALKVHPANGRAHARIAAIDLFEGKSSSTSSNLRDALKKPGIGPEDIVEINFALGHTLDSAGKYGEAAKAFTVANRSAYRMLPPSDRYDPVRHEVHVREIIQTFHTRKDRRTIAEAPPPIFICGMFRSGSTLAEQILARHSRITAGGELEFIPALAKRLNPYTKTVRSLGPVELRALATDYISEVAKLSLGAQLLTDKRPDNFLHIGLIKSIFPNAKIVHTTRNVLDNLLSIYFLYFADSVSYGFKIQDILHYISQYRILMQHWKMLYGDDIYDLDYDVMIADPDTQIRDLLRFCGLPWETNCLTATRPSQSVKTASNWQVRQPLYARSSGRWQNYRDMLSSYVDITALLSDLQ